MAEVTDLIGRTFASVINKDDEQIVFTDTDGGIWTFYHGQDCCESVYVEDIVGDLGDLVGTPLLEAEEVSGGYEDNQTDDPQFSAKNEWEESWTWTFYKFATIKGRVTIRWYGSSNGYYSESVYLSGPKDRSGWLMGEAA